LALWTSPAKGKNNLGGVFLFVWWGSVPGLRGPAVGGREKKEREKDSQGGLFGSLRSNLTLSKVMGEEEFTSHM